MRRWSSTALVAVVCVSAGFVARRQGPPAGCDAGNVGLTLPQGFCAGVFARGIAGARHMAVADNGDVFVITNPAGRRGGGPPRGVFRLRDGNGDGRADSVERVADGTGSGIWVTKTALYSEGGGSTIVRYALNPGTTDLAGTVDTIVSGIPRGPDHVSREFVIRGNDLFVNVGSPSNICEKPGNSRDVPWVSADPCPELATRAGIWKFDATKVGQVFSAAQRYVTGLRNGVGITFNPLDNELYSTQHGRDQLRFFRKSADSLDYNAENPGEEFFHIVAGGDYGWPYCFYSFEAKKKVTGPEYGGDGTQDDRCRDKQKPLYAFPGHWAPNGAMFYTGRQFPAEYRGGVFVAFHGSWNRAPLAPGGYNVTFLPFRNGQATGPHRVFADGFYGDKARPTSASGEHRPVGLAQLRDGSLLVSDDAAGTIFHIVYTGK